MQKQKTITQPVSIQGHGLFSGKMVNLTLKPAPADSGIVFVRTDLDDSPRIPANIAAVVEKPHRTALRNGATVIETVEHCLAAIAGLNIDNLEIEVNGGELPNIDGSCAPYTDALLETGFQEQDRPQKVFVIAEPIVVKHNDALLYALPDKPDQLTVIYELDYPDPAIGRQIFCFHAERENFIHQISPARTFATQAEAQFAQEQGIGSHLSFKDVLVFGADGPIDNKLRFDDECARHKVADLLGDVMLLGHAIQGRLVAYRSGHACNQLLVKKLAQVIERRSRHHATDSEPLLDIRKIQKILPHRYPFLLVDRVIEIEGDRRAVGFKNVTMNEPFFQGHFPTAPIMPGVLIVEAMAQMAGLLFAQKLENTGQLAVLLSMDRVKMRRAVVPGDQLILEVEAVRMKSRTGDCRCRALVAGQLAAEAQIRFMLVDADPN